jgi:hypothetical protein
MQAADEKLINELGLINPRRMRRKGTIVVRSVCVSVCLLPRNLLPTSFLRPKPSFIGFFMVFSRFLSCGTR